MFEVGDKVYFRAGKAIVSTTSGVAYEDDQAFFIVGKVEGLVRLAITPQGAEKILCSESMVSYQKVPTTVYDHLDNEV